MAMQASTNWGFDVREEKIDPREKLRQYFLTLKDDEQVKGWDDMWRQQITPWDRNQSNPALLDALSSKKVSVSPFQDTDRQIRKKALVPGCGKGYDVLLFASYGFDAYGLDASSTAIDEARKVARDQGKEQHYPLQNIQHGRGEAKFVATDFFQDDFLTETHSANASRTFDLIYDYTFLCALPPSLRSKWAARMSQLLSPSGLLICMEYPLGKSPKSGGPPHGLQHELYEQLLSNPGSEVNYNLTGHVCEDRSGNKANHALVRGADWVPERTFEAQKGQIRVSVWRHWKP